MRLMESRMTQKGQITIPAEIRARLGIKPKDKVQFILESDGVKVVPAESRFLKGYGAVPPINTPEDWRAVRREFEELVAEDADREGR